MRVLLVSLVFLLAPGAWASPPSIVDTQLDRWMLTVHFDQPMLTWGNDSRSTALRLTPAVDCSWYWEDDTTLRCQWHEGSPLRPATTYRLDVGEGLWSQAGEALPPSSHALDHEPPQLWLRSAWKGRFPTLTLYSSQGVDVDAIADVLELHFNGAPLAYRLEPLPREGSHDPHDGHVSLVPTAWPQDHGELEIRVREGLRSPLGPVRGKAGTLARIALNVPFRLVEARCGYRRLAKESGEPAHCEAEEQVSLYFSRAPSDQALARIAASLPPGLSLAEKPRECDWACNQGSRHEAPLHVVKLDSEVAGRDLVFGLPAGLESMDGQSLDSAPQVALRIASHVAAYRIDPVAQLALPGQRDAAAVQGRNLPEPSVWRELSIGSRLRASERRLKRNAPRETWVDSGAPEPRWGVLRHGGLSFGGSTTDDVGARVTSRPAFNLLAHRHGNQVLAWTTAWADGAPLAKARVELLEMYADGRLEVLASSDTAADGTVGLVVPESAERTRAMTHERYIDSTPDRMLMLRARHAGSLAVLPLHPMSLLDHATARETRDPEPEGGRTDRPRFGVTSRLLYRPGETVQFRLWLRERAGNRLQRPRDGSVTLALAEWHEPALQTRTAGLDHFGSVAGEWTLPEALADGEYCIDALSSPRDYIDGGACFTVSRFQAHVLWATLQGPTEARRTGESLPLSIEGGFYSGGPASGARLALSAWLEGMDLGAAYPDFARFQFATAPQSTEINLIDRKGPADALDGKGRREREVVLPTELVDAETGETVPFAQLSINAEVGGGGGEASAASPTLRLPVAAFDRYVGLASERRWLSLDESPRLEAVVVGYDGVAVPGEPVQVRLERGDVASPEVLGNCTLVSGTAAPCAVAPEEAGYYRLVAASGDAAATRLTVWFGEQPPPAAQATQQAWFELLQAAKADAPARVRLVQPHARAWGLFVLEHEGVVRHWAREVGPDDELDIPLPEAIAPGATLRVMLRPRLDTAQAGLEAPTLDAAMILATPPPASRPGLSLELQDDTLAPADVLRVTLRNDDARPRRVVVSVVDDAVHQQMAAGHGRLSPGRDDFLGSLQDWREGDWHGLHGWDWAPNLFHQVARDDDEGGSPTIVSEHARLETLTVVGSRIRRADVEPDVPAASILGTAPAGLPGRGGPRVRRSFPEAAYWNADIELAAGEERTLEITLPDNLTRWRVLAWSGDDGDGFDFSEATATASLPVELRFGVPHRLFEGDVAQGSVTARNASEASLPMKIQTAAEGAGLARVDTREGVVAPHARLEQSLALAPDAQGAIDLLARADARSGSDAISTVVPVQSRWAETTLPQAGWLASPVSLRLPELPSGARDAGLDLRVHAGTAGWRAAWLRELREYPHGCWEQTLSRALGAALALQDAADRADWPGAQAVVDAALTNALAFRDEDGGFHFFTPRGNAGNATALLDAHTLRRFGWLRQLGQAVPDTLVGPLLERVQEHVDRLQDEPGERELEILALALAAQAGIGQSPDDTALERAWAGWASLSWHGRSELLQAMAAAPGFDQSLAEGLARLHAAGEDIGARRVVRDSRAFGWAMGSDLRDQCAVTATLWALDRAPARLPRRQAFLRGLQDLYAGGTASLDTQSSLHCLLALRAVDAASAGAAAASTVHVSHGPTQATLALDARRPEAAWQGPVQATGLDLSPDDASEGTLNYVARLRFRQDLARVEARGVGLSLQRRYAVLRGGRWLPIGDATPREGEWIRVTLSLDVPALRHFVAITDPVPGGWVTRDVGLAGVAGANVQAVADPGSWWFDTRRTGSTEVRLYAETLPPGRHEVHYFAQAVHPGRYFAPPAVAELMYGRASRANTAGNWVEIRAFD